ncbi:MAG: DUF6144 family protein [Bacteroidales bacterium]|jgi:hypothetical protein|nr:DUF6144 family protein [Bacteroidales bacterium]
MDRKVFLRKACLAGACSCGFGAIVMKAGNMVDTEQTSQMAQENQSTPENMVAQNWLKNLLENLDSNLGQEEVRRIVKMSSVVHYDHLKMDDLLSGYTGRLREFLDFLETEWGWKIEYNKATGVILADENKSWCVCPVLGRTSEAGAAEICYCSEGFAEQMFSKVTGIKVTASVISSVRRGDKTCIYRIEIPSA